MREIFYLIQVEYDGFSFGLREDDTDYIGDLIYKTTALQIGNTPKKVVSDSEYFQNMTVDDRLFAILSNIIAQYLYKVKSKDFLDETT